MQMNKETFLFFKLKLYVTLETDTVVFSINKKYHFSLIPLFACLYSQKVSSDPPFM